jgi:hypothetical protein
MFQYVTADHTLPLHFSMGWFCVCRLIFMILGSKESSHYFFSASESLLPLELIKLIYKFSGKYFTPFPPDANRTGKPCLFVYKIRKELTVKISLIMYRLIYGKPSIMWGGGGRIGWSCRPVHITYISHVEIQKQYPYKFLPTPAKGSPKNAENRKLPQKSFT